MSSNDIMILDLFIITHFHFSVHKRMNIIHRYYNTVIVVYKLKQAAHQTSTLFSQIVLDPTIVL